MNAPFENRVSLLVEEQGLSEVEAVETIREMDQQRKRWVQFLYDVDTRDPVLFDIVLNLHRMVIDDAIELVATELEKSSFSRAKSP